MDQALNRSEHIAYSTEHGDARQYEYEMRWKIKILDVIQSLRIEGRPPTVLDFGCGRGEFLQMLRGANIDCVGVDFDSKCVELGSKVAPCYQATLETVSSVLKGRRFDLVSCQHVLEHMEYPKDAVRKLAACSNRWLIFAVPNLATPVMLATTRIKNCNTGHHQGWDAGHFLNFLENKCGLRIVRWIPDTVVLPKVSRLFDKLGIRRHFEYKLLPRRFPYLSLSLIALCEKTETTPS